MELVGTHTLSLSLFHLYSRRDSNHLIGGGNNMQYLIRTLTDSTNHTFIETIKARENETFTVVEAKSKEEAEEIAKRPKGLLEVIPSSFNKFKKGE